MLIGSICGCTASEEVPHVFLAFDGSPLCNRGKDKAHCFFTLIIAVEVTNDVRK